ncbi:MAG TPA: hypothetical protein GX009_04555 [Candidatus Atribacteria bacterium]|nr:hypothetical protein [Candidatus Atribacteria bacterium]
MKLKAENKVGAHQGEHCSIRITHFSGIQVRQFDARLDIIFLLVPRPLSPSAFSANTPPRTLLRSLSCSINVAICHGMSNLGFSPSSGAFEKHEGLILKIPK